MMSISLVDPRVRIALGLIVGLVAGLLYGWLIQPVEFVDTTPDSLRADYRTDYVLMVAEAFQAEQDLNLASRRLAVLGPAQPHTMVETALVYAQEEGFIQSDLARLENLADELARRGGTPEIGGP
jgi:hypothetical protein